MLGLSAAKSWRSLSSIIGARCLGGVRLLNSDTVRIGCASGFWGDTTIAGTCDVSMACGRKNFVKIFLSLAPQLVHHGNIDFLVSDYLSEITMSLLSAMKHRQPVSLSQSSGHHALSWLLIINFAVSYIFKAYGVYCGLSCKHEATAEASEGEGY